MQLSEAKHIGTNVPATLVGWEKEGRAKVELLADAEGFHIGSLISVGVRADKGRTPPDFSVLNKQGLRVGGIVLLRRLRAGEDGELTARAVEILVMRESDGAPFVIQNAAASIRPAPEGTAMVKEALVVMLSDAIAVRTLSEGVSKVGAILDQPGILGNPGLAYFGRTKDGEPIEVLIGGDGPATSSELMSRLLRECPKDVIKDSRTSGTTRAPWKLAPFFRAPIDPDRSSKLSAQAANHDYGSDEKPRWTTGNVVLRTIGDRWNVSDASPSDEPAVAATLNDVL